MKRSASVAIALLALSGCGTMELPPPQSSIPEAELLSGAVLFGSPVETDGIADVDPLAISAPMREFLQSSGTRRRITAAEKIDLIRKRLLRSQLIPYDASATLTAPEMFESRFGNCLSFTNLFVALGRVSGLTVTYQRVELPPIWYFEDGFVLRSNHINAVVKGSRHTVMGPVGYVVDFGGVYTQKMPRQHVRDEYALALMYANHGVEALRGGNAEGAFRHFKKAISVDSSNPDLWVNLGAIYGLEGQAEYAAAAYRRALVEAPGDLGALSGLARSLARLGLQAEADRLSAFVKDARGRDHNYRFVEVQRLYHQGQYEHALSAVDAAIDERAKVGRFHLMKSIIHFELEQFEHARASLEEAERFGWQEIAHLYQDNVSAIRTALVSLPAAYHQ